MSEPKAPLKKDTKIKTSEALLAFKDKIVEEWIARIRSEVPPAKGTEKRYLVNSLPHFLTKLADSLEIHKTKIKDAESTAAEHAEQRVSLKGFSLPDVLKEYKILRQVIFDCLEEKMEIPLRDRNIILDFIQTGTIEVASEFCRLTQEEMEDSHATLVEARNQFVASLAHDLKTPLSSARLMAQFLKRNSCDPLQDDAIAMTLRNIDRVDKMVENFLDVNQIIANRPLPAAVEDCNLTELLKELEKEMNVSFEKRFILRLPKEEVVGRWNSSQVIRCLENICNNAIKYGDTTTPITITLSVIDQCAKISIHNLGEIIPESQRKTLFEPYQRAPSASRSGKKGWGLGLTLVKGVAETHGGRVELESDEKGTTFSVLLPLKPAEEKK